MQVQGPRGLRVLVLSVHILVQAVGDSIVEATEGDWFVFLHFFEHIEHLGLHVFQEAMRDVNKQGMRSIENNLTFVNHSVEVLVAGDGCHDRLQTTEVCVDAIIWNYLFSIPNIASVTNEPFSIT